MSDDFERVDPSLFRSDIFQDLTDLPKFKRIIGINTAAISMSYGCAPKVTARKLENLYHFYIADRERALAHGSNTETMTELDHFKDAAFLCFWFRRASPIGEIRFEASKTERGNWPEGIAPGDAARDLFSLYADEVCGFLIGFHIIAYFEYIVLKRPHNFESLSISDSPEGLAILDNLREVCSMLKHKNMSPHAIYLMYKFLFSDIGAWRR